MEKMFKELQEAGFKPMDAVTNKREVARFLRSKGLETAELAEVMLDFQWLDATEEDFEETRRENERLAKEDEEYYGSL